jgi:hypothetical protein
LIREVEPEIWPVAEALVSTRVWPDGFQALQAYRPRWHIEDESYRELKEGWGLEEQRWGRDVKAAQGRVTLTCLAFNTAQVYRSRGGQRLARKGIRRLRREYRRELGAAPAVIYLSGCYAVLSLEELLAAVGTPVRESLLPFGGRPRSSPGPPETLISKCLDRKTGRCFFQSDRCRTVCHRTRNKGKAREPRPS